MKSSLLMSLGLSLAVSAHAGKVVEVGVKKDGTQMHFVPDTITIEKGTTVRWTNNDPAKQIHNVMSGTVNGKAGKPDGKFKSTMLLSGKTFEFTFNEAGEFPYFCQPHVAMGMIGKVVVK